MSRRLRRDSHESSDEEENEAFLSFSEPSPSGLQHDHQHLHLSRKHHGSSTLHSTPDEISALPTTTTSSSSLSSLTMATAAIDPLSIPAPKLVVQDGGAAAAKAALVSSWSTIGHQLSFLATGIFSTIAVQWLYYQGAASSSSMLTVFFNYVGMMCVGLIFACQSWYADRKQRRMAGRTHVEYDVLMPEVNEMTETNKGLRDLTGHGKSTVEVEEEEYYGHVDEDEEKQGLRSLTKDGLSSSLNLSDAATAKEKKHWARLHWPVIQVAVMDVIANALVTIGFFYVGSGMYQVIYSSIVIWCAILTRIFLGRHLNNVQWVAIVGVTFGLAVSAVGTTQDASPDGPVQSWIEKSFGALITLGATFLYACVYVLSDKVLATFKPTPVPEKVCSMVGGYASFLTLIYLSIHTFPNWQTEVLDLVETHQGHWVGIFIVYPLLTISSMLHSLNYYVLLSRINNIAVGILQSLRAVLVFVMSHYLFCGISSTQCFNEWKFISAIVVIGCVTLFSFNSTPSAPVPTPTSEPSSTSTPRRSSSPAS